MDLIKEAIKYYKDLHKAELLRKRLVDKDLDYDYLQQLVNQVSNSSDLIISIKTRDGALITIKHEPKQEQHATYDLQEVMVR